jgi:exosortase
MLSSPSQVAVEGGSREISWVPVAVFGLVWIELISRLRFEWSINPQYGYGWTVPFLAAYIFWKRYLHSPAPTQPGYRVLPAFLIFLCALILIPTRLIQEANPDWRLLSWLMASAVAIATASAIYLAGGRSWVRHFAFPLLFFFVAVPWPTGLEQIAIQGLMRADAWINVEILNAIGIPAVQMGNVIEIGSGYVGIDEACTGIRSLQATFMVALFLGEFYQLSVARRAGLVLVGAVMAFLCNIVRTFLLVRAGVKGGAEGIKSWHDPAGYTILTICLLGLWAFCLCLQRRHSVEPKPLPPSAGWRIPRFVLGLLLGGLVVAEASTQAWYRSQGTASARLQPWTIGWPNDSNNWKTVPIAESAQDLLRYNEGGGGTWTAQDGHKWNMFFFRWFPGRTAGLFVRNHRPDICLPATGMKQRGSMESKLLTVNDVSLPVRAYVFDDNGRSLHVFYCYWDGTESEGGSDHEDWTPLGRLDAVRKAKRDVGSQMLEIIGWGYDDNQKAEQAAIAELSRIIRRS